MSEAIYFNLVHTTLKQCAGHLDYRLNTAANLQRRQWLYIIAKPIIIDYSLQEFAQERVYPFNHFTIKKFHSNHQSCLMDTPHTLYIINYSII